VVIVSPSDPVTLFLPTLARARSEGVPLPPGEPAEERRVSALIVHASIVRRRSFTDDAVLPPAMLANIERGEAPPPTQFIAQSLSRVIEVLPAEHCKVCLATPGQRPCRVCNGRGTIFGARKCYCENGLIPCPTCGGTASHNRVRMRYYSDEPAWMREVYVPSELVHEPSLFTFESTLERAIGLEQEVPECLRCHDLNDRAAGTAYRGGERQKRPDFRGYDFSDTVDKALAGLSALGAGMPVPLYAIQAFAWPILWLRYAGEGDRALYAGRDGQLKVFEGTPPE
jgi:hypothetical protein